MAERKHESIDLLLWRTVTATWTLMKLFLIYVRTRLSLCWTLPVLFSMKKVQIPTRLLTLTNIRITNLPREIDKKNLVRRIQSIILLYYLQKCIIWFFFFCISLMRVELVVNERKIGSCRQGVQDKSALGLKDKSAPGQIGT